MTYSITLEDLRAVNPCRSRLDAATAAIKTWPATAEDAFAAGLGAGDVLWIGFRVAFERRDGGLRRRLLHAVADIAGRALPIFEKHAPNDARPRGAIDAVRQLADSADSADTPAYAAYAAYAADDATARTARTASAAARSTASAASASSAAARSAAYAAYAAAYPAAAAAYAAAAAAYAADAADAAYASYASYAAAGAAASAAQKRIVLAWLSDTPPARAKLV